MSTGRLADKRDAFRIAFILRGVLFDPADGLFHVFDARWIQVLGGQAIVDREPGKFASVSGLKSSDISFALSLPLQPPPCTIIAMGKGPAPSGTQASRSRLSSPTFP